MFKRAKECLTYTAIFALGYLASCGDRTIGGGTAGGPSAAIPLRMLSSSLHRPAIFPSNTGNQLVLATALPLVLPQATISNPSQIAQSYESLCDAYGPSATHTIHAAFGSSGFVSLNFLGGNLCDPVLSSVGADEGSGPTGFPIILAGSVNTLVAYGTFASGSQFRCMDTTNVTPLPDNVFVRAYYDLAHDAIVLGSATTQLQVTCSIVIPPGDDVQHLTVQWLKS